MEYSDDYTYMSKRLALKIMYGYCEGWLYAFRWLKMPDHYAVELINKNRVYKG